VPPAPLFASHRVLNLTIEAPLSSILKDRSQTSTEHPGTVTIDLGNGERTVVRVQVRTRGNTRLRRTICDFPPLRLDFDREQAAQTLFSGQDKLKLVTHCQDHRSEYEQYVLQEYLTYRVYNLLTELSFRVRLARITYLDTEAGRDALTRYAFMIESDEQVAGRNDLELIRRKTISPADVDPLQLSLLEVFQYLIGNTDWSAFVYEEGKDECCHNTLPIATASGWVFPVPYDFDIAGIITARYADNLYGPQDRFGIRSVRQRLYIGRCDSEPYLDRVFQSFDDNKNSIYSLYREQADLGPKVLAERLDYLDEFFDVIHDPAKVRRRIVRDCRPSPRETATLPRVDAGTPPRRSSPSAA
jgi:hypothetical protein